MIATIRELSTRNVIVQIENVSMDEINRWISARVIHRNDIGIYVPFVHVYLETSE